jgi:hypothetical protein
MPNTLERAPWRGRKIYWEMFDYNFTGTYLWTVKNWVTVLDWGKNWWCDCGAGNLLSTLIWHHPKGILSTIRLESVRDGIEDNALFQMLRSEIKKESSDPAKAKLIAKARKLLNEKLATKVSSDEDIENIRRSAGDILSEINTINARTSNP